MEEAIDIRGWRDGCGIGLEEGGSGLSGRNKEDSLAVGSKVNYVDLPRL